MSTLNVSYQFNSDTQGFTFTNLGPGTWTGSWNSSFGNPSGSLQAHKTIPSSEGQWVLNTTWNSIGVPSGSTISGVTSASYDNWLHASGLAGFAGVNYLSLVDGSTNINIGGTRSIFNANDSSWTTTGGTDSLGLSLPASDSITLTADVAGGTSGAPGADVWLDNIKFTVTYNTPYTLSTGCGFFLFREKRSFSLLAMPPQ
jgi:hypothetical protein